MKHWSLIIFRQLMIIFGQLTIPYICMEGGYITHNAHHGLYSKNYSIIWEQLDFSVWLRMQISKYQSIWKYNHPSSEYNIRGTYITCRYIVRLAFREADIEEERRVTLQRKIRHIIGWNGDLHLWYHVIFSFGAGHF